MNQQALHGQAINQIQQQPPMAHMQAAGNIHLSFIHIYDFLLFKSVKKNELNSN